MTTDLTAALIGIASGAVFALVALALSLTFRTTGVLNVAQGDIAVLAAYAGSSPILHRTMPYGVVVLLVAIGTGLLMWGLDLAIFRPLRGSDPTFIIMLTIGISYVIESLINIIWGGNALVYPPVLGSDVIRLGGVRLFQDDLVALVICLLLAAVLGLAFRFSSLGRRVRAGAGDALAAELVGVDVVKLRTAGLVASGVLSGLAGMFFAPLTYLYPTTGLNLLSSAFVGAVIGGFGSMPGAVVGCLLVGLVNGLASTYISSIFSSVVVYGLLVVFLIFRSSGIFGEEGVGVREI